jgi:hypothetical protein
MSVVRDPRGSLAGAATSALSHPLDPAGAKNKGYVQGGAKKRF